MNELIIIESCIYKLNKLYRRQLLGGCLSVFKGSWYQYLEAFPKMVLQADHVVSQHKHADRHLNLFKNHEKYFMWKDFLRKWSFWNWSKFLETQKKAIDGPINYQLRFRFSWVFNWASSDQLRFLEAVFVRKDFFIAWKSILCKILRFLKIN